MNPGAARPHLTAGIIRAPLETFRMGRDCDGARLLGSDVGPPALVCATSHGAGHGAGDDELDYHIELGNYGTVRAIPWQWRACPRRRTGHVDDRSASGRQSGGGILARSFQFRIGTRGYIYRRYGKVFRKFYEHCRAKRSCKMDVLRGRFAPCGKVNRIHF